jgi:cyclophilin family peptidyl-prolyl cis-trans isomerase
MRKFLADTLNPWTLTTKARYGLRSALAGICLIVLTHTPTALAQAGADVSAPKVKVSTNLGDFVIQLDAVRAPLTTANFLSYVRTGHYSGTIFHRVISGFVVQGGGFDVKGNAKTAKETVANESGNGLTNKRGTVGLARSEAPHSGNAQFYVNLTDNDALDPTPLRWGYAVFGKVIQGMDVVDRIAQEPTGALGPLPKDAPINPVVIKSVEILDSSDSKASH